MHLSPKLAKCQSNAPPKDLKCAVPSLIIKCTPGCHWNLHTVPYFVRATHSIFLMIDTPPKVAQSFMPENLQLYYQNIPHVDYIEKEAQPPTSS